MEFSRERIRLLLDVESHEFQRDGVTEGAPEMWRNNDVQFELGFMFDGQFIDASLYSTIKLIVVDQNNRTGPKLMEKSIASGAITPVITQAGWDAKTHQHAVISFTAAETRLDLGGANSKGFFLSVIALTNTTPARRVTLGSTIITLHHDGDNEVSITPPIGSSVIPLGVNYDGTGNYILAVTPNKYYRVDFGDNDTKIINGGQEVLESGNFVANGASITLVGDPSALITATLRTPVYLTLDEMEAAFQKRHAPWLRSENGRFLRQLGVTNDGMPTDQVTDLEDLS